MPRQILKLEEIRDFSSETYTGFYESVLKIWQDKQEINLSKAFSRN